MNIKRRHPGHMGGGMNQGGNHGGHRSRPQGKYNPNYNSQRPRKNYPAMREKYLNQARDAMSAGDRVLAEYYMQHADHCYRMQMEFQAERAARYPQQQNNTPEHAQQQQEQENQEDNNAPMEDEVDLSSSGSVLPAFITGTSTPSSSEQKPVQQNWEEE